MDSVFGHKKEDGLSLVSNLHRLLDWKVAMVAMLGVEGVDSSACMKNGNSGSLAILSEPTRGQVAS